jgi:hypothetical protein
MNLPYRVIAGLVERPCKQHCSKKGLRREFDAQSTDPVRRSDLLAMAYVHGGSVEAMKAAIEKLAFDGFALA